MTPFIAEIIGTAFLVLLGDGVVANVVLNKTNGNNSGWIVITFGWAIVFVFRKYHPNNQRPILQDKQLLKR